MATVVDSLVLTMSLDPNQVKQGMAEVDKTLKNGFKAIAGYIGPLLGAAGIKQMAAHYLSAADELGKFSKSIGANVEDIQAWSGAVEASGGSAEGFKSSLTSINKAINEISMFGTSSMSPVLQRLGINAIGKKATDILPQLANQFQRLTRAQSLQLGQKLGLDEGTILLLQQGGKSVTELVNKMRGFNEFTQEDTEIARKFNFELVFLKRSFLSVTSLFMNVVTPALTVVSKAFTSFFMWIRENKTFVITAITLFAIAISAKLIPAVLALTRAAFSFLVPFIPWILAIGAAALVIDDFISYLNGGKSALEELWSALGSPEEIQEFFSIVKAAFDELMPYIKMFVDGLFSFLKVGLQGIVEVITFISSLILALFGKTELLKKKLSEYADFIKDKFNAVKSFFGFGGDAEQVEAMTVPPNISNENSKNSVETKVSVGQVVVNTNATDAAGIATNINGSLEEQLNRGLVLSASTGVAQK